MLDKKSLFKSVFLFFIVLSGLGIRQKSSTFEEVQSVDNDVTVESKDIQRTLIGKDAGKLPLAEKLFPEAELIWGKEFEGRMTDFVIAKKSGNVGIAIISDEDKQGYVYYFMPGGKLLWNLSNQRDTKFNKVYEINLSTSNDGKILLVSWRAAYESSEMQVYDERKNLLFKKYKCEMCTQPYGVSVGGKYIFGCGRIRSINGEIIEIHHPNSKNWYYTRPKLISDNEIFVLEREALGEKKINENDLLLISLVQRKLLKKNMDVQVKREVEEILNLMMTTRLKAERLRRFLRRELTREDLSPEVKSNIKNIFEETTLPPTKLNVCILSLPDCKLKWKVNFSVNDFGKIVTSTENYYLIQGRRTISKNVKKWFLYKFDTTGTLIWERQIKRMVGSIVVRFNDERYLTLYESNSAYFCILDIKTGEILIEIDLAENQIFNVYSLFYDDYKIMLSGERTTYPTINKPWNWIYIWYLDSDINIVRESLELGLTIGTSDSKIVGIYQSNSEERSRYQPRTCKNFNINILKKEE